MSRVETLVAGVRLEHPLMNASGILGSEPEHIDILVKDGFSAIVTKSFTIEPRTGYEPPILIELEGIGYLNAVGLANPGVNGIYSLVKRAKELGRPIFVSIAGTSVEEFIRLASVAEETGADAIELNLSCPHVAKHGIEIGRDLDSTELIIRETASVVKTPVIAKLGLSDKVVEIAGKALEAGARALTLINTIRAMAIDPFSMKPILRNKYGGLSGPAIKPISVRIVYDIYREYRAEIIGCGGVASWRDVVEYILAGASAVQIGSGYLKNKSIVWESLRGLIEWMRLQGFNTLREAIGYAHRD